MIANSWAWVAPAAVVVGAIGGLLGGSAAVYVQVRRKDIEKYVAELDRVSYEHEVVFSRLHERRVEVIADLYGKMVVMERAFGSWVHPLQPSKDATREKAGPTYEAAEAFEVAFQQSRIWLDKGLCDRIDGLNRRLYEVYVDMTTYSPDNPRVSEEHINEWHKSWKAVTEEIPPLRRDIEDRFREMLGVVGPP